jgi:uncharacterized protein
VPPRAPRLHRASGVGAEFGAGGQVGDPAALPQIRDQKETAMPLPEMDPRSASMLDDATRTELEAAAFRRLVQHLRERSDVQNIDMMNLAGFCRNCLSRWYREAAEAKGLALSDPEAREIVYGMPYKEWQAKHQKEATPEQKAKFAAANPGH